MTKHRKNLLGEEPLSYNLSHSIHPNDPHNKELVFFITKLIIALLGALFIVLFLCFITKEI